ncbi:MAG TPA: tRNA threonylcarbamoyladenosine dehydratase [Candidatus Mediterraneibacter faecavium]|uniref:tRNA threonylcarbamoyladenosine dehydratase n=1 Tax=Candidatus Mediterraneibacter faecavium TaxID=2838668 RepID=A0A9D2Q8D4_9FIRM|nr:tRNA threonylcarbamoyladenosine dehydratase [Candidatus Mediterraneibacter faecavium]
MVNQYSRTELLIGAEGMELLKGSSVMVFGVGGVGSHCIEALARSGIGKLILIDNDTVSLTNINRQSIAYHSTVGQFKTLVMKERIRDIDPSINVKTYETFVLPENLGRLLDQEEETGAGKIDYIVDAIDTVSAKLALAEEAQRRGIRLISSMGTGNKLHPELFEIDDLSKTSVCPLCRVMRRELKQRGIQHLKVLYSKEKPVDTGGRETGEEPGVRRSIPGSISFVPPTAGLLIAGEVIRELAGLDESSDRPGADKV